MTKVVRAFLAVVVANVLGVILGPALAFAGGGNVARKTTAKPFELYHPAPSKKGTVLLFHGFSNSTAMWKDEAQHLFEQGFDVMVAALPGHGFVDKQGNEDVSRVPKAHESAKYQKFASAMFDLAAKRSGMVHVAGLSVGGTHALEVALSKQDVRDEQGRKVLRSLVAINPYLSPTPKKVGPFQIDLDRAAWLADRATFGRASARLTKMPYVFEAAKLRAAHGSADVGLTEVDYGTLYSIGRFGDAVQARAKAWHIEPKDQRLPATIVITERDPTASPVASAQIAERIGAAKVVVRSKLHNLVTKETNPSARDRALVREALVRTFEAGLAAAR